MYAAIASLTIIKKKKRLLATEINDEMKLAIGHYKACVYQQRAIISIRYASKEQSSKYQKTHMHCGNRSAHLWSKSLLNDNDLKGWLHRDLRKIDKIAAGYGGHRSALPSRWHPEAGIQCWLSNSRLLESFKRRLPARRDWRLELPTAEITDAGKQHLRNLGVTKINAATVRVAADLRNELPKIKDSNTRAFAEEATIEGSRLRRRGRAPRR